MRPTYEEFIRSKEPRKRPTGFVTGFEMPAALFPFQEDTVKWALRQGSCAIFAECGLGKTIQQLTWAQHVAAHTKGQVLVLAPLAVAQQTIREGQKFGISASYAKDQSEAEGSIVVTNYERLDGFDATKFSGVVLDESSILKSFSGKTKRTLISKFEATPFRLACTATPSPNDITEIGNHSEFLGAMPSHEMLSRWFINDLMDSGNYRIKNHAKGSFWRWVTSWARCIGKPSDVNPSFSDTDYTLPPLESHEHIVDVDVTVDTGGLLFRMPENSATSIHAEKRKTASDRAKKVAEIVHSQPNEHWIVWCETDYEADALKEYIPQAREVRGSHSTAYKEEAVEWFCNEDGKPKVLISKASIFGFGINMQHCARVAFVGATFSFESYYQAIRRTWRFGQRRPVQVHVVMASTEASVYRAMQRKAAAHQEMNAEMWKAAREAQAEEHSVRVPYGPVKECKLPAWLKGGT